jgi:hypothetical protein
MASFGLVLRLEVGVRRLRSQRLREDALPRGRESPAQKLFADSALEIDALKLIASGNF